MIVDCGIDSSVMLRCNPRNLCRMKLQTLFELVTRLLGKPW